MLAYIFFWISGVPFGLLLKVFFLRLQFSIGLWLAFILFGGIFYVIGFVWKILPPKAQNVLKILAGGAVVGFIISCFI